MTAQALASVSESERQHALDQLRLVGSLPEHSYEDIVHIAAALCDTPIALISLLDREQQWFKAKIGLDAAHTERNMAVCDHAIRRPQELMEVGDLDLDSRFVDNPVLKEVGARFYAGMPLVTRDGAAIGTVCVLDHQPRQLNEFQRQGLEALGRVTMTLIEARSKERTQEVGAILDQAVLAATPLASATPAATTPALAPYAVVIWELQDLAGTARRLGDRAMEKELARLDQELEACLEANRGDSANRVTGTAEFVVVLNGSTPHQALDRLEKLALVTGHRLGVQILMGVATTTGEDPAGEVFMRADQALSAQKDARLVA